MRTIIMLEFKRMLKSKMLMIVFLVGILMALLISLYEFNSISINKIDENGNNVRLQGFAAIEETKRIEESIQGELTQERVAMIVEHLKGVYSQYDSYDDIPQDVYNEHILPYEGVQRLLIFALPSFDNTKTITPWSIDQKVAESFPQNYFENIKIIAQDEYKDNPDVLNKILDTINSTQSDKLQYYTSIGWNNLCELFTLFLVFLAILSSILFAPMYSGPYQSGMSEVFACTRNGKTELGIAKCITTVGISILFYFLCVGLFMGINILLYGTHGLHKSLTVEFPYLFVSGTIQSLFLSMIIIGFFAIVAQACLSLLFSSICKSSLTSVVFSIMFAMLPFMLSLMTDKSNVALSMLPASGAHSYFELVSNRYLQIGSSLTWYPNLMWVTAIIYIILFCGLSIVFYKRHQYR